MTIYGFNDVSHLLKAMRNALYNNKVLKIKERYLKLLNLTSTEVKWEYIVKLFEFDQKHVLKIAPHIKAKHIYKLGHYNKMKVGWAKAILCEKTGHAIRFMCNAYPKDFPPEALTTAVYCEKVGLWHNLAANHHLNMAFWAKNPEANKKSEQALKNFEKFYTTIKLHPSQKMGALKPSQSGLAMTNKSLVELKNKLFSIGFEFFLTGKCTNDPVEQYHGDHRSICRSPSCCQWKRNAKLISISDYMGHSKHGNHNIDASASWMTELQDMKKMAKANDRDHRLARLDFKFLKANKITAFSEKAALAYLGGFMLKRTIVNMKTKCTKCIAAFVVGLEDKQIVNHLITLIEYKAGALVRPSVLANKMFFQTETLFRSSIDSVITGKGLTDRLGDAVVDHLKANFPEAPKCHIAKIFKRFVKVRLYFEGEHRNSHLQIKNSADIQGKTNASKSSKAVSLQ